MQPFSLQLIKQMKLTTKLKEIQKDIDALSKKAESSQLTEFEKANLKSNY